MKMKLGRRLSLLLFIISFSLYFGQKAEFTMPQNIETQSAVFNFSNDFTKDEPKAVATDGEAFSATVDLYNLEYGTGYKKTYLKPALKKGAKAQQFIQHTSWNVTSNKEF
jgi:hypothetical protein